MKRADLITLSSAVLLVVGVLLWWQDPRSASPLELMWVGVAMTALGVIGVVIGLVTGARSGASGPDDPDA